MDEKMLLDTIPADIWISIEPFLRRAVALGCGQLAEKRLKLSVKPIEDQEMSKVEVLCEKEEYKYLRGVLDGILASDIKK